MQHTRESINELLKHNDKAIIRALLALNQRQTSDEQAQETTKYQNNQGFTSAHAPIGTSMAKFYLFRGYLTPKQIAYWRRPTKRYDMRISIYTGQLLKIAQEKADSKPILNA